MYWPVLQQLALQLDACGRLASGAAQPWRRQSAAAMPTAWALWAQVAITRVEPKATCEDR